MLFNYTFILVSEREMGVLLLRTSPSNVCHILLKANRCVSYSASTPWSLFEL